MVANELETIWNYFNEPHFEDDYPSKESFGLSKLGKDFESKGDAEKVEQIKSEINLLNRIVKFPDEEDNVWKWCIENITKQFPSWDKKDVEYYKTRFGDTTDSLNKARYAYSIWTSDKSDIEYARKAVENFFETGKRYGTVDNLNNSSFSVLSMSFKMAVKLSLSIIATPPIDAKSIFLELVEILKKIDAIDGKFAIIGWLIDTIIELSYNLSKSKDHKKDSDILQAINDTRQISKKWSEHFSEQNNFEGKEKHLKRQVTLSFLLGDSENANLLREKVAESFLERAELSKSNGLLYSHFAEEAVKIYSEIGMNDKVKELGIKCQEAIHSAFEKGEFKEISTSCTVPTGKFIDQYQERFEGKNQHEIITQILSDDDWFLPSLEKIKETEEKLKTEHPIPFLFSRTEYSGDTPSRVVNDGDKQLEIQINKAFLMDSSTRLTLISEIFTRLIPNTLSKDELSSFLFSAKNIESNEHEMINKVLEYYVAKDYFGFCHVIIPRLEHVITNILKNNGDSTVSYDPKDVGFDQKLMGGLIRDLQPHVDECTHKFLEVWLTQEGQNVRNKISHGWMDFKEFNWSLADLLLYILLKLSIL